MIKNHQKKLVIILPTYNEVLNIKKIVSRVLDQEKKSVGWRYEIIISDSASPDGTGKLADSLAKKNSHIHYIDVEKGLGVGLIKGFNYAVKNLKPDALAQLDADGQIDPEILPKMTKAIDDGNDLVIGSRFMKGSLYTLPFARKFLGLCSSLVCRVLIGPISIHEFTASARAFTPDLYKRINLNKVYWKEKTFIVLPSFLNEAIAVSKKYKEIPLICRRRELSYSKNKIINYTYDIITYSFDCRFKKLGFKYNFFDWSRKFRLN